MRISDWSSDVCSSDLALSRRRSLHALLHYCPYPGVPRHRSAAARWIARRGMEAGPGQVIVCNGAQEGGLTSVSAIAGKGETVVTEKLKYAGDRHIARRSEEQTSEVKEQKSKAKAEEGEKKK